MHMIDYKDSDFNLNGHNSLSSIINVQMVGAIAKRVSFYLYEPRHDKMCLREFPTRPGTNRHAQQQKLARVLKFRL